LDTGEAVHSYMIGKLVYVIGCKRAIIAKQWSPGPRLFVPSTKVVPATRLEATWPGSVPPNGRVGKLVAATFDHQRVDILVVHQTQRFDHDETRELTTKLGGAILEQRGCHERSTDLHGAR